MNLSSAVRIFAHVRLEEAAKIIDRNQLCLRQVEQAVAKLVPLYGWSSFFFRPAFSAQIKGSQLTRSIIMGL